jgi:patatin-like phospholipase/acyl hydrolase
MTVPRLPDGEPNAPPGTRRLLCLSGGGYRGLFTAVILERIEERLQRAGVARLRDHFELIAGTSVGGLLACGLTAGIPAKRLRETLEEHGPAVFPRQPLGALRQVFGTRYSADALERVVVKCLGPASKDRLPNVQHALIIPAVSWITGEAVLYQSAGLVGTAAAMPVALLDVCLATSAAPTYFPAHAIDTSGHRDVMVDGGLAANAPDLIALSAAMRRWALPMNAFEVVSIGTAGSPAGGIAGNVPQSGIGWARSARIVKLVLASQERLIASSCATLLGGNYFRIDQAPTMHHPQLQALDQVDDSTTATLVKLADVALANAKASAPAWAAPLL